MELTKVITLANYYSLSLDYIRRFIPPHKGTRESKTLDVLTIIYANPGLARANIKAILGSNNERNNITIAYLTQLGYVETRPKPFFISPLKRYRIDKIYYVTSKGLAVLKQLDQYLTEIEHQ